ncbi:bifunctional folylpolyglutamate synthase/dihydrofolate synthase [Aneurinibacillus tyrosinisolvens]|uniref:bifunctional folylpolyglutamate synthase/dihydrofolate synthase n=1 Tax=Aneurinibacillus tyrosinisolvens TaxID=1443435 RepID=UPI00063FAABC|nr:Mur ligase family protein [Aneurinibacillus tyrosinisolvens]
MRYNTMQEAEDFIYASYLRAVNYIPKADDSITRRPALTRELLDRMGEPDKGMKIILVTGSKGKGSTSRFISSILSHCGYKTGLFTSPHLVHFNERIRIDGKAISDSDFVRICSEVSPFAGEIEQRLSREEYQGPVGITLAVALKYYRERGVDYAVVETGRGGCYDDTNVLANEWAVIGSVFEEHIPYLGSSLRDIVRHKTGIVKEGTQAVIVNKQSGDAMAYIEGMLAGGSGDVYYYGRQFRSSNIRLSRSGTHFDLHTDLAGYPDLRIPLLGAFQADNVAAAVKACECITGKPLAHAIVKEALQGVQWPGRCEIIDENPTVVLDGTINAASAGYVKEVVESIGARKIASIIAVPEDKDYEGVMRAAGAFSDRLIVTKPDSSHKAFPANALETARRFNKKSKETGTLAEAVELAKADSGVDLILILGTQTFIGSAKRLWDQSLLDLGK